MKIATYNILKGGLKRQHWLKLIQDHSVDLLLVQESYRQTEHLPPLLYPDMQKQSVWEMVKKNGWGSAVFSGSGSVSLVSVPNFSGWVVGAEINGAAWQSGFCDSLLVFSVHAPKGNGGYSTQLHRIYDEIARIAGHRPVVIGGDFNLAVSNWTESEKPVSKKDLAVQSRLADEFGLINCWQEANPGLKPPQTLRWNKDRTTPYHCDGIFVPKAWKNRLQSCSILSGDEWTLLSDHNPVVASFS